MGDELGLTVTAARHRAKAAGCQLRLSGAVADRYFLQGANAVPTVKLAGLA